MIVKGWFFINMAVKRLRAECVACLINKYICSYPDEVSEDKKLEYVRRFLEIMQNADDSLSSPVLLNDVNNLLWEMFGIKKDFTEMKKYFNDVMLGKSDDMRSMINASDDPLLMAI